jgi:hypothetical protein
LKIKIKYLEKLVVDLVGQLNDCTETESHVLVFALYHKKTKTKYFPIFIFYLKETNWNKEKSYALKIPSVPKGRG